MSKVKYVITVCDEFNEFSELCKFITSRVNATDIIVLADENKVTEEIKGVSAEYGIELHTHPMNGDFSKHRNFIGNKFSDGWLFYIDADEIPSDSLIRDVDGITDELDRQKIYIAGIPRLNIVNGLTQEYVDKWRWRTNDVILEGNEYKNAVNFPDMQFRIHRCGVGVHWYGKVHERLTGSEYCTVLDYREGYYLKHIKSIERQKSQNELYDKIALTDV